MSGLSGNCGIGKSRGDCAKAAPVRRVAMIAIFFKMVIILISFLTVLTMRPLAPPK
jgi:hypothetical protein